MPIYDIVAPFVVYPGHGFNVKNSLVSHTQKANHFSEYVYFQNEIT